MASVVAQDTERIPKVVKQYARHGVKPATRAPTEQAIRVLRLNSAEMAAAEPSREDPIERVIELRRAERFREERDIR